MSEWISVEDRLPREGKPVWVFAMGQVQKTACRWIGGTWEFYTGEWEEVDDLQWPTKWTPLPAAPEAP